MLFVAGRMPPTPQRMGGRPGRGRAAGAARPPLTAHPPVLPACPRGTPSRCGNVAAILELDDGGSKNFKVRRQ